RNELPETFSLLDDSGSCYVTEVKSQRGGTCWAHATIASMESNLMKTGLWELVEEEEEPNLAEYHLDWWNGFNNHNNDDVDTPEDEGIWVHQGGDYLMSAAYLSRGEGAVRELDGQNYDDPPERTFNSYHEYYPMHIEWYTMDDELDGIDDIKESIMENGGMSTSMLSDGRFREGENLTHYQPPSSDLLLNHAVTMVGWDDNKVTMAPEPGAWLIKNSWGSQWPFGTYFWISYYDKYAGRHPELGAVSFRNVSYLVFDKAYYHDYHGWRDTWTNSTEAFNSFTADRSEQLQGVSFFTTEDDIHFKVTIYDDFEMGKLKNPMKEISGYEKRRGLHTHMFDAPLDIYEGDDFHIMLEVSGGGIAFDRTSKVPLLLGPTREPSFDGWVNSTSAPNQSFYRDGDMWEDLYLYNNTSNFCIKGLVGHVSIDHPMTGEIIGPNSRITGPVSAQMDKVNVSIDGGPPMSTVIINGKWGASLDGIELQEGTHRLTVHGYQDAYTEITATSFVEFTWESDPPITDILIDGPEGYDNWFLGPVNIAFLAEDNISDVKNTFYGIDGGNVETYNGTFTVTDDGVHTIEYWSVDVAENVESSSSSIFKIDSTLPEVNTDLTGTVGTNDWFVSEVELSVLALDDLSGIDRIAMRTNMGPWKDIEMNGPMEDDLAGTVIFEISGTYIVDLYPVDKAGNVGETRTLDFRIDLIDPMIRFELNGVEGEDGWFRSPVKIMITTEENNSRTDEILCRFLDGLWDEYNTPLFVGVDGSYTVQARATDLSGRTSPLSSVDLKIDTSYPGTECSINGEEGSNGWFISNVSIKLSSSDKGSGVGRTWYRLDEGPWMLNNDGIGAGEVGSHILHYYSEDRAGNIEERSSLQFRIDLNDPWVYVKEPDMRLSVRSENMTFIIGYGDIEDSDPIVNWSLDGSMSEALMPSNEISLLELEDGDHWLILYARDCSGRSMTLNTTFQVNTSKVSLGSEVQEEEKDNGSGSPFVLILIVISAFFLLVSAVISAIILIRRKGNDQEVSDPSET
ncbi:MAG: lectin like domain-containing protein, partial [Candidatus Thermoplasmatota archaeon]|nr:lectin like domain-containing protein [Candidatus Thermoplasmatota archaeon]